MLNDTFVDAIELIHQETILFPLILRLSIITLFPQEIYTMGLIEEFVGVILTSHFPSNAEQLFICIGVVRV